MPDITMCEGIRCSNKETYHRYTATPSQWRQSYFIDVPVDITTNKCDYYWKSETISILPMSNITEVVVG